MEEHVLGVSARTGGVLRSARRASSWCCLQTGGVFFVGESTSVTEDCLRHGRTHEVEHLRPRRVPSVRGRPTSLQDAQTERVG